MAKTKKNKMNVKSNVKKGKMAVNKSLARVAEIRKDAQQKIEAARQQFTKAETHVKKYVNDHPEKAAIIAAAVGVAIGAALTAVLMGKKRDK